MNDERGGGRAAMLWPRTPPSIHGATGRSLGVMSSYKKRFSPSIGGASTPPDTHAQAQLCKARSTRPHPQGAWRCRQCGRLPEGHLARFPYQNERPAAVSRGDVEAPPSTGTERKKPGGRAWRKRARSCKAGDQRRPSGGKSRRMQDEAGAHGRTQPQPAGIPHHGPGVSGTGRATPLAQVGAARLPARPGPAMPGGRTVGGGTPALRAQSEG
nr:uncharacterized protein LOC105876456 isoform X3 [Microcebus murinus]